MRSTILVAALAAFPLTTLAQNPDADVPTAVAVVQDRDGNEIGNVRFLESPSGYLQVIVQLEGLDAGVNAAHLHETGECEGDFSSAGGHIAGDKEHGIFAENGPHPGDLPNVHIQEDGVVAAEFFTDRIDIATMMDDDGSAFILHNQSDDYTSQPAGNAGDRIACGVVRDAVED
ncbi:Cu-Zn family superoxide dismutase [Hasllibacter halocynthiae]|uniref:Superoxide dismutase [Cu-Zn] n=1 Tax=Hasllibacter halocynthiae TaxID=595589 RepID=A0A2T0X7R4_9RHOB|nr:superoxide dismutase family protein [Hasllibacter halocynthiae]PRY94978.1 Cu-Zn family superoxide dismutase [Hasllibacter halocynthiae]